MFRIVEASSVLALPRGGKQYDVAQRIRYVFLATAAADGAKTAGTPLMLYVDREYRQRCLRERGMSPRDALAALA